jgi:hypothetical protein
MRAPLIFALLLAGCGDEASSKSTSDGTDHGSDSGMGANNAGSCPGGLCAGACFEDGWCVADSHDAFYVAMWVESADEIWLAEQNGMVRAGAGRSWTEHPVPGVDQINDIIGDGRGTVWVSTHPAGIYRFDAPNWVAEEIVEPPTGGMGRLARDTVTDTLFAESGSRLYERSGERWSTLAHVDVDHGGLSDVANCGGQRFFCLGAPTLVEGGAVRVLGLRDNAVPTVGITLPDGTPLVAGDTVVTYTGRYESITNGLVFAARSIAATSLEDIWALVSDDIWHFDGAKWSLVRTVTTSGGSSPPRSLYTDSVGQLLLIDRNGRTHVLDATGAEQSLIAAPTTAQTLGDHPSYQVSSEDLWVATPSLNRWTPATQWQQLGSLPSDTRMFVVQSPTDVWAVVGSGDVYHWDSDTYRRVTTGLDVPVTDVAVSDSGMVWVAGPAGVAHYDGSGWTTHPDFDAGSMRERSGDVTLVARGGEAWVFRWDEAFRWDGAQWETTLPQRRLSRLGCDGNELVGLAHQPPALVRGRLDQMEVASSEAGDENYSTFGAWMTGPEDVWITVQGEPAMQHLQGAEWNPSLLDVSIGARDVQQIATGHVFALTNRALLVRGP